MATLSLVSGYVICVLIGLIGLTVLWKIWDGSIDLSDLISEANGGASLSRFQFLIFTFVIALSLFLVIVSSPGHPQFPATIPGTILSLLGISGSSYLVSKGIQFSDPAGITDRGTEVIIHPSRASVSPGKTQQFTVEVPGKPGSKVKWEVVAGPAKIDDNGLFTADPAPSSSATAPTKQYATVQATSLEILDAYDIAVVTIA
jgi:hypothetical protein